MSGYYKIKGLNKFVRNVQQKPKKAQEAVDKELNRSSLRVEMKAKKYAAWDTGFMSSSIYSFKLGLMMYEVTSPANYSIYVELGTRRMSAQPFMYPAMQEEYITLMANLKRMFN